MKDENQELDKTLKEAFKEINIERPGSSFLDNVMSGIESIGEKKIYQPLISRKVWWGIAATITVFIILSFNTTDNMSVMNLFADKKLPEIQLPSFDFNISDSFTLSKSVIYGVILASLLLLAQIYFIKNRFNRNFETR